MEQQEVLSLCKRRGFLWPAYDIYGGVAGLYDYGPLGSALKRNIEDHWRRLYVLGEGFFELECPVVAPEPVFKASGHLDAFSDLYVECKGCGETFRADHLASGLHGNPAALKESELARILRDNGVRCPSCKGEMDEPKRFNLMFKTSIGAGTARTGYLRPETAQGMFVNFSQVYRHGRERLPVGAVQVGRSFRNEISPRQGLLRLREFSMMEAELFVHPEDKSWPAFARVENESLRLVPSSGPEGTSTLREAVSGGVIANETLAYFMWLTYRFVVDVGLDPKRVRFRQHARDEMAHYATDCWDCEAEISTGWTEVVGVADRGCYDVQAHVDHSGADLTAFERFEEPKEVEQETVKVRFDRLGKLFKGKTREVADALARLPVAALKEKAQVDVLVGGENVAVPSDCLEIVLMKEKVAGRKLVPHVIEPSYGVDRILYCLLEHAYAQKEDYVVLRLKGLVAPLKAGVFPLMARDGLDEIAKGIYDELVGSGIMAYYDDSGSIGRRYARMDEVGTPCCVTVDYETKESGTVTVRDRDTAEQIRIKKENVGGAITLMVKGSGLDALSGLG